MTETIEGAVERGGETVEGAHVLLVNQVTNTIISRTQTDSAGAYTFDNLIGTANVTVVPLFFDQDSYDSGDYQEYQDLSYVDTPVANVLNSEPALPPLTVAYGAYDNTVYIHDIGSDSPRQTIFDASDYIHGVAWSPDGSLLACASEDTSVYVFNTSDWSLQEEISDGSTFEYQDVEWNSDGSMLAYASSDAYLRIRETDTWGLEVETQTGDQAFRAINGLSWNPDDSQVACADGEGAAYVLDPTTGDSQQTLSEGAEWVYSVSWSRDGSTLAVGASDNNVYIYDTGSWSLQQTLSDGSESAQTSAWSPDESLIACGNADSNVYVYDTASWDLVETVSAASGTVYDVSWSRDGTLAYGTSDNSVYVHDPWDDDNRYEFTGPSDSVRAIDWKPLQ